MNSKMILGQYYNVDSPIHRLDPRTKLISLFALMISIFLMNRIPYLLGMFVIIIGIVLLSKVPLKKFFNSFKMMTFILMFTMFFQIVFTKSGQVIESFNFNMTLLSLGISIVLLVLYFLFVKYIKKFKIIVFLIVVFAALYAQTQIDITKSLFTYSLTIYEDGITFALRIVLRIINLICISSLLTLTTKPTDLTNGLESISKPLKYIGVNVSIMAMMISISLRFIPTLINEANRILKAQASRGVDFKESKFNDKIIQIISLLIPMIVIAYKRAEDLANAMEARGYIPGAKRSKLNELKYMKRDVITFGFTLLLFVSSIIIKVMFI
ncbi:MAG: energy-coupling factor transporter transmembrane component T [Bacilli bacterium]|jgi:energy-coupling factor transport system permease protein